MAITQVKIHPAIGVARLGNSPDDFFIGPERVGEHPMPEGGFKDNQCRIKRQAVRFRIFAYHDDGPVEEVTTANAAISWTVHLANKKAINRNTGSDVDLTIDPGIRTLSGPNQQQEFGTGQIKFEGVTAFTVLLGEIRTDSENHLLVLGGSGQSASPSNEPLVHFADNPGWYDDIADGPVKATVIFHGSGVEFTADGAWVIVAPPKFAPHIDNVITLYDRIYQMAVDKAWVTPVTVPSYTNDIFPILQRARDTKWVQNVYSAHSWADPIYDESLRTSIFNRLKNPAGGNEWNNNMPDLYSDEDSATLTPTQYQLMEKWKDGSFIQDWLATPAPEVLIKPDGLDRTSLENCVGAAFFPGIEAGGLAAKPIIDATKYVGINDPFRLSHTVLSPGDITASMAVPWQADFKACSLNWWPVPRPNDVIPQEAKGTNNYLAWDRSVGDGKEMVDKWHLLGFVVKQGTEQVEVDRCDIASIQLLTPALNFVDIPQGLMGTAKKTALAINFEVSAPGDPVILEVLPAHKPVHPRLSLDFDSVTAGPTVGSAIASATFWVIYETGTVGETLTDKLTVTQTGGSGKWVIPISANTVARKVAATAFVLDRSGSMQEDRGDGQTKYQSLKEAASILIDVMPEGDGLGIVGFNQNAQKLQNVLPLGPAGDPFDTARANAKAIINGTGLTPSGETSIGDGIVEGRQILDVAASPTGYDVKALVVLTDGKENREKFIAEVAPQINERTYSIGLGKPENISVPALQTISGNNGGYLLVTGPVTGTNQFILQKYFLQILSGINNTSIVLDPDGELMPNQAQSIPFLLTEADECVDVVLLTPNPQLIDFRVQTPNGFIIDPALAASDKSMVYVLSDSVSYYRLALPAEVITRRVERAGTWKILLRNDVEKYRPGSHDDENALHQKNPSGLRPNEQSTLQVNSTRQSRLIPYSVLVTSSSNLSVKSTLQQAHYKPGEDVILSINLTQNDIPILVGGYAFAETTKPDGSTQRLILDEKEPGLFRGSFSTTVSGTYHCRIRATGKTKSGYPFHREQTRTASVWEADDDYSTAQPINSLWVLFSEWVSDFNKKHKQEFAWIKLIIILLVLILICLISLLLVSF